LEKNFFRVQGHVTQKLSKLKFYSKNQLKLSFIPSKPHLNQEKLKKTPKNTCFWNGATCSDNQIDPNFWEYQLDMTPNIP